MDYRRIVCVGQDYSTFNASLTGHTIWLNQHVTSNVYLTTQSEASSEPILIELKIIKYYLVLNSEDVNFKQHGIEIVEQQRTHI